MDEAALLVRDRRHCDSTTTDGTWLFLLGSIELLIRPIIRLGRDLHVQRLRSGELSPTADY